MNQTLLNELKKMIDVNTPIICIQHYDYVRIDEIITCAVEGKKVFEWNPATGATNFKTKEPMGNGTPMKLEDFLREKYLDESEMEKFIVLKDIQDYLNQNQVANTNEQPTVIKSLLGLMAQRRLYDPQYNITTMIVTPECQIPADIEKFVSYLEIPFPNESEINQLIDEHIEVNCYDKGKFTNDDRERLMPSLKGLTAFEIDRMLDMAMSSNGSLSAEDSEMILQQKKRMVKKSGLVELIDTPEKIDDIGGLNSLKAYLKRKANIIRQLPEARKFHVNIPKGVFIIGMPGCGKSLCAKASATLFQAPLLKLDMGSIMGKYVGQSEENLRKAIKIAEAAAPCVLWIDEIEKGFSGIGGHSDVMTRLFGYFLTWLQDKTSSVYVIATANSANNLPPELKRKGRFDEIFCVNLPNEKERQDIFSVHLKKRNQSIDMGSPKFRQLITATEGFNGADIESVVNEAIEDCFLHNRQSLTIDRLLEKANATISISKSCRSQIDQIMKVFKESNFKNASA